MKDFLTQNGNLFGAADRFTQKGVFSARFCSSGKAAGPRRAQAYCGTSSIGDGPRTQPRGKIAVTKRIELSFGKYAIVDAEDYDRLSQYKWCAVQKPRTCYAKTFHLSGTVLSMHRLVANAPKGLIVDHINHNGLDNRKSNLRLCTNAQNQQNSRPRSGGTSKYKGVHWHKVRKKFCARIHFNKKSIHIGYFKDEIDAAKAYDKKARELFGEFAYLNF